MPRISAATNAAQRENTKRAILESFGKLLYSRGLPGLTMTDVAKNAGIGRTAVYNYFADMGELLVAYALDETERFLHELDEGITGVTNPIDQLAVYIRLQIEDLARRHLPPGPAMRSMLSPESYARLGKHVSELQMVLANILSDAITEKYIPETTFANSRCSCTVRSPQAPDAPKTPPTHKPANARFKAPSGSSRWGWAPGLMRTEIPSKSKKLKQTKARKRPT